jgi:prevent-host-death family protein
VIQKTVRHEDRTYTADVDEAIKRADTHDEHVVVTRHGQPLVAIISMNELEILEALEDERDLRALREAEADDDGTRIAWEDLTADLGR